jgi:hypothetical protein
VRLLTAERAGTGPASEDRIFTTENGAVVLDGVTGSGASRLSPGGYADALGLSLARALAGAAGADLRDVLAEAIAATASRYHLEPGCSPQGTVAVARWGARLDLLVLGDTIAVVYSPDGGVEVVRDAATTL